METQLFVEIPEKRKIKFKMKLVAKKRKAKDIVNLAVLDYLRAKDEPKWSKK